MKTNNTPLKWLAGISALVLSLGLGGCNLPGRVTPVADSPDLIYTAAAHTVVALVSQTAQAQPIEDQMTSTAPVHEATWTPEPTFTETPTQTPTATFTKTPIPDAILEDDFSNTSLWYVAKAENYGFEYQDGGYRIYNQILNGTIWSIRDYQYKDIQVEVDASRLDGPEDGYYGVVCRLTDDGEDYYALVIGDNGFYGILRMFEGESEFLQTGVDDEDIIRRGQGQVNHVTGVCTGSQLLLIANGQQLLALRDESLATGDVGLVVGNTLSGTGIDVLFDNFALVQP